MIYKNYIGTHKMYKYVFEKHRNVYHGRQEELKQNKKKPQTKIQTLTWKDLG